MVRLGWAEMQWDGMGLSSLWICSFFILFFAQGNVIYKNMVLRIDVGEG
jgi:hypothetical protein